MPRPGDGRGSGRPPRRGGPGGGGPGRGPGGGPPAAPRPRPGGLTLRPIGRGDDFEIVHPRCVAEREDDYGEGLEIYRAGEPDEAREVLRFALDGCPDNLWIHALLGRIALEADRDPTLARGHFGYAVELVEQIVPPGFRGRLPRAHPANRPLYDALDGLAACLDATGPPAGAAEVRRLAAAWSGEPPSPRS